MARIVAISLFAVEAEAFDDWQIVEAEQAGVLALRRIAVLVPCPGGNAEDIALFPLEARAADHRITAPLGDLVEETAGVSMRFRSFAWSQQLHARADRLHHMSAGDRIDIIH